jgi:hypothetical protein
LYPAVEERHTVVVADHAFFLHTQDLGQVEHWHGDERAAFPLGRTANRALCVVM